MVAGQLLSVNQDLLLLGRRHPDCTEFIQKYPHSSIVTTLEALVFSPNHFICKQAIYTLGKTCSYDSIDVLNQAFTELRDTAPLVLPRLLGELMWLGSETFWDLIDSMMSSSMYPTRWAVPSVLGELGGDARVHDDLFRNKLRCIEQLRRDANILVRVEAEYEYQLLKLRSAAQELTKTEYRKQRKELEQRYKPALCFTGVSNAFTNHMHIRGLKQYSIDELEIFVAELAHAKSAL